MNSIIYYGLLKMADLEYFIELIRDSIDNISNKKVRRNITQCLNTGNFTISSIVWLLNNDIVGVEFLDVYLSDKIKDMKEYIGPNYISKELYVARSKQYNVYPRFIENSVALVAFLFTDISMKQLRNSYYLKPSSIFYSPMSLAKSYFVDKQFMSFPDVTIARLVRSGLKNPEKYIRRKESIDAIQSFLLRAES